MIINYTSAPPGSKALTKSHKAGFRKIEPEEDQGRRRIRGLYIVKSRGMGHSSDVHKLILSDDGMNLVPMDADATAGSKQKSKVGKNVSVGQE